MGAAELIQGLGRALAVLREAGHPQHVVQQLEDDITSLDAVLFRDAAEAEQWAARLVARLYGIPHAPAAEIQPREVAPGEVLASAPPPPDSPVTSAEPVTVPEPEVPADPPAKPEPAPDSTQPESSPGSSAPAEQPEPDTHMATPAEVTGAAQA